MMPELYTALTQDKVIKEAALRSGVSKGVMQACWDAAGEVIKAWATEGHSVALPGLGTMRFGLRAKSVASVNDVRASLITSRRIIFTPDVDLKDELKNTAVQITCYDRDGKEVKRVTSTDDGTVEDPEQENGSGNGENGGTQEGGNTNQGGSGSESGSQNSGSSQNQGGNSGSGSNNAGGGAIGLHGKTSKLYMEDGLIEGCFAKKNGGAVRLLRQRLRYRRIVRFLIRLKSFFWRSRK